MVIGPPAPVPPEVAIPRPTPAELEQWARDYELVIVAAYRAGTTRLLDNILVTVNEGK